MAELETLEISGTGRDQNGNILAYCGHAPYRWRVFIGDLVDDIEGRRYRYVVRSALDEMIEVVVRVESQGKIVRTHPDAGEDLLAQLPRC